MKRNVLIPAEIFETELTAVGKLLLLTLYYFANEKGIAIPSIQSIEAFSGLSIPTIERQSKLLEKQGFIRKVRRKRMGSKAFISSLYIIKAIAKTDNEIERYKQFESVFSKNTKESFILKYGITQEEYLQALGEEEEIKEMQA